MPLYNNLNISGNVMNDICFLSYYGAKGDGISDDSNAINNAIKYCKLVQGDENKVYKANIIFTTSYTTLQNVSIKGNITFNKGLMFIFIKSCDIDASNNDYGIYSETNVTKLYIDDCYVHNAQIITDPSTIDGSGGPGTSGYNLKNSIGAGIALWDCWDSTLTRISTSSNATYGFIAYQFNNGTFLGTSYSNNIGMKIIGSTSCRIQGTLQENKNTGLILSAVHGSFIQVYLEQNGYEGIDLVSKSQLSVGYQEATCIGTNMVVYAIGGAGSAMESTTGILLDYASNCNINGYAIRHLESGLRVTSNSRNCKVNFVDTTHTNSGYDNLLIPNNTIVEEIVDCNSVLNIPESSSGIWYTVRSNVPVLSSYEQLTSNTGIIRAETKEGVKEGLRARLYIQTSNYGIFLTK